jgi:hypothetical protein
MWDNNDVISVLSDVFAERNGDTCITGVDGIDESVCFVLLIRSNRV